MREEVINRIVKTIFPNANFEKTAATKPQTISKDEVLLSKASSMLKTASSQMRELRAENEKLAFENEELQSRIENINKHSEAEKLAKTMVAKGMLKSADIDSKVSEIMEFDKTAFELFKDAIDNISVEKTASTGMDSLAFMYGSESDDTVAKKKTMVDAVSEYNN